MYRDSSTHRDIAAAGIIGAGPMPSPEQAFGIFAAGADSIAVAGRVTQTPDPGARVRDRLALAGRHDRDHTLLRRTA